jgi:ribosomal protein L24E
MLNSAKCPNQISSVGKDCKVFYVVSQDFYHLVKMGYLPRDVIGH